jgi:LysR family transcriptional activator of nhaA
MGRKTLVLELNYHHLYYFFSVVKAGSITNASADLLLSPPTISAQLKKFEKTVKRKLFEKKGQGLRLTAEGRVFFDYARQIFLLGDQLQDRIRDNTVEGVPSVQFGVMPGLPHSYIEATVGFIRKQEPTAPLLVDRHELEKLLPQLGDRRVDFIVTTMPILHLPAFHLENTRIGTFPLILVANAAKYRSKLKASNLKALPFIIASNPDETYKHVKNYYELAGVRITCETADRDDAMRLALKGEGVTAVDEFSFKTSPFRHLLCSLKSPQELSMQESVYLSWIPRKLKNPLAEKAISSFRLR